MAVDQEGGRVARLREPFTIFPGNEAIGIDDDPAEKAREFARITAREMKLVGLNMNLAPVVDVRRGKAEDHLRGRMFSEDSKTVAQLGRIVVRILQKEGVMAVAKHFPGLGRAAIDPHFNLPAIDLDIKEINEVNLPPFMAVIEEGVSAIMTSHAIYPALDKDLPATLSTKILDDLLRTRLDYKGIIISDDLEMGAIVKKWGAAKGALASFRAGSDLLLICKEQRYVLEGISLIRQDLLNKEIPMERLNRSNRRIKEVKSEFFRHREEVSLEDIKGYFGKGV